MSSFAPSFQAGGTTWNQNAGGTDPNGAQWYSPSGGDASSFGPGAYIAEQGNGNDIFGNSQGQYFNGSDPNSLVSQWQSSPMAQQFSGASAPSFYPSAQQLQNFAPQGINNFGGLAQANAATWNPTMGQASTGQAVGIDPIQANQIFNQYAQRTAQAQAPGNQQAMQNQWGADAERGIFNSGASAYNQSNLAAQQGATYASSIAPMLQQLAGYQQQDVTGNAAAQNNQTLANQSALNNQTLANQGYTNQAASGNAAAANNASLFNAGNYNTASQNAMNQWNNYQNELMQQQFGVGNASMQAYLGYPQAGINFQAGQGPAASNAYQNAYNNQFNYTNQSNQALMGGIGGLAGAGASYAGKAAAA